MVELTSRFSKELGFPFSLHLGEDLTPLRNATLIVLLVSGLLFWFWWWYKGFGGVNEREG